MNRIYKVIWNATLLAWVAVSEQAKGKTKSSKITRIIGAATVSLMITFSSDVNASIISTDSTCVTSSTAVIGNLTVGPTTAQATDGSGTFSLVAGCNAKGNNFLGVTVYGAFAEVIGLAGMALGVNSKANAFGTAVGVESRATGIGSTALGEGSQATGQNAVALGGTATGSAAGNVLSVANAVTASGSGAVAIGGNAIKGAQSAGTDAVAIGAQSTVSTAGTGAVALGARTNALASGAVAIGDGANASIAGSTALGANTTTSTAVNSTTQTINGKSYTAAGTADTGVVSVGSSTIKRQIQNVAAGQVTASSTDAINGSQLFNTNTELAKVATDTATALGGGATAGTAAGGVTAPSYTITKTDGTTSTANNVGDALSVLNSEVIKSITFSANTGSTTNQLGSTVTISGVGSTAGTYSGNNVKTVVTGSVLSVQIADAPNFAGTVTSTGLQVNGASTITGNSTIGGTQTVTGISNLNGGANLNSNQITGLASGGTISTNAANIGDVATAVAAGKTEVATGTNITSITKSTGGNGQDIYTVNANGTTASAGSSAVTVTAGTKDANNVIDYTVDLAVSTKTDIQKGVDAKTAVDNTGLTFKGDTAETSAIQKLGDTVSISGDTNISTIATTDGVQIMLNPNLDLGAAGSVTIGNSKLDNSGLTITGGPSVTSSGINAANTNISNVADAITDDQAVNKGQLDSLSTGLTNTGFGLKAADGNTVNNKLGEAVEVVGADSNITTKVTNGQVAIELNKDLNNLTSITVNDGANGTNGSTVIGQDGLSVKDGSGNTIVGLDNTALTVKDASGNTETSINQAINTLNASQGETDKFAVKYDKNADGSANYDSITLAGTGGTTITNVNAGAINSTSTDAINGSQLYGIVDSIKNVIGGSTTIDPTTGAIIANNIGGTGSNTLDGAISSIKDSATKAKTTVTAGENIVVTSSTNADGSENYEVSTAKDLVVDSVKAGDTVLNSAGISIANDAVVLNNTGLTIAGGPSVTLAGINAGNTTISNVANAVNATDAVNKGQLDSAISTVNNNVNELTNNAIKYDDASKDNMTLGGADGTTIQNVKEGTVAENSKDAVNGGQLWNVQQQVDQNSADISNIKNYINNGVVGLVQQTGNDATVTVAKDTGGTSVSVAGTDGNRVVTGVNDGAVNATSTDAVNGSQLNTTNQAVVNYLGGGAGYDNITDSFTAPTYNVGDSNYNNVGGAIDALNQVDQALNSKIDNVSNKLENAFLITNNRIDDVEKKANAGIAAAMALQLAPYIPGKYTYAVGVAYHGGENAVGVTLRKTANNGRWSITGGVAAASQGDPSFRVGISGVLN